MKKNLTRRVVLPIIAFVITLSLTAIAAEVLRYSVANTTSLEFSLTTGQMQSLIEKRLTSYGQVLSGLQGLFAASHSVEQDEWDAYIGKLGVSENLPGLTALSYVPKIDANATSSYPHTINPLHSSSDPYYPITYLTSFVPTVNPPTYGFNLGFEPVRLATINHARDSGVPQSTAIVLAQGTGDPFFSIYAPLYENDSATTTLEEKRNTFKGFVFATFGISSLFETITSDPLFDPSIDIEVFDATSTNNFSKSSLIYSTSPQPTFTTSTIQGLYRESQLSVSGRTWTILFAARPGYGSNSFSNYSPLVVLVAGTLFSLLVAGMLYLFADSRETALSLAQRLTNELLKEKDSLAEAKAKDEAMLESMGDAVFAVDQHRSIILFNPIAEHLSGYKAADALGKPFDTILTFVDEVDGHKNDGFVDIALSGVKTQMSNHTQIIRKDGVRTPVSDSASPIKNSKGKIVGAIVVFRDVSHEREVDKAKTEFVSLAAHQLRTPLSAIGWYSEMLLAGDAGALTKKQEPFVTQIHESNVRMVDLVTALLNVSRIDLGTLASEPVATDIATLVESVIAELMPQITEHSLQLVKQMPQHLSLLVDPKLMRIIVQNLLTNAVKYTPDRGTITIMLSLDTAFHFTVTDTGFGIPLAQQSKIFDKLFRADNAKEKVTDGTGLGLYLVKSVVEKHDGKIWFESLENKGSTFFIELPASGMKAFQGSKTLS